MGDADSTLDVELEDPAKRARREAEADTLALAVARSKVAAALFATHEPVKVGRYHLLEQIGAGGMGVVWGAWDPELDRRVAIKLVKPELAITRERIVREGQALAKLSNPHVVPVYDVGVVDDRIYLVMELVRGETLRAWSAKPHAVREIVHAYHEAAIGLAAAHDAGLVHRDFKPENAMLGADGRVRVLDFGLAQGRGEADGIAGTPRYMAPEQRRGDQELTPAVDQYALGIALRDALPSPPPKWLGAIIARATADAPGDRFPSMHALVAALGRDPARVLRRRLAIAGAVGLAGATFAIGMRAGDDTGKRCGGGAAEIAAAWDPAARDAASAHLKALGPYGAQIAELAGVELDGYARRWVTTQTGACRAHDRGELTTALYTSNLACLTRAKVALATARDVLATAKLERLPAALVAVRSLPAVERCRTETTVPPPAAIADRVTAIDNDVARARVLALAIDPRAIEVSAAAARAADEVGYPRLIGHAALVHGIAQLLQQSRKAAVVAFTHATQAALEADDDATAIEAIARQLYAIATGNAPLANADKTIASLELAMPIAKGLGGDGAFARALFYNNLGTLHLARQDRDGARTWFIEADRVRPPPSRDTYELVSIGGNLGLVEPDRAARDAFLDRAADETETALGADHPFTLDARLKAAMFVEHPGRSAALLRDACDRYRTMHPQLFEKVMHCAYEMLWRPEESGDARAATEALAAITGASEAEVVLATGYRELLAGKHADALAHMAAVATELAGDKSFWRRWRAVDARIVAAVAADRLGDRAQAIAHAEAALAAIDGLGEFAATTFVQRRRGRVLAMLARLGAGDVATRKEAALAWARLAGGYDARIAQLTAE